MTSDVQERRLVLRAQSGDRESMASLLDGIIPPLLGYLRRVVGDPALAEDVAQDTLLIIVRKLPWLTEPSLLRPWMFRIASREAFRALKKRRAFVEEPLLEVVDAGEQPDLLQLRRLESAVDALPPASRAVITLHYLEEMTLADIAEILEISIGTVKSRLAYGLTLLRKEAL